MHRQGDILIIEVDEISAEAKKLNTNDIKEGESTGHSRRAVGEEVQLYVHNGRKYIEVSKDDQIVHEEHKAITLIPGKYEAITQREYLNGNVCD